VTTMLFKCRVCKPCCTVGCTFRLFLDAASHSPCSVVCGVCEEQWPCQRASVAVCQVHAAVQVRQQLVAHAVCLASSSSDIRPPAQHQGRCERWESRPLGVTAQL